MSDRAPSNNRFSNLHNEEGRLTPDPDVDLSPLRELARVASREAIKRAAEEYVDAEARILAGLSTTTRVELSSSSASSSASAVIADSMPPPPSPIRGGTVRPREDTPSAGVTYEERRGRVNHTNNASLARADQSVEVLPGFVFGTTEPLQPAISLGGSVRAASLGTRRQSAPAPPGLIHPSVPGARAPPAAPMRTRPPRRQSLQVHNGQAARILVPDSQTPQDSEASQALPATQFLFKTEPLDDFTRRLQVPDPLRKKFSRETAPSPSPHNQGGEPVMLFDDDSDGTEHPEVAHALAAPHTVVPSHQQGVSGALASHRGPTVEDYDDDDDMDAEDFPFTSNTTSRAHLPIPAHAIPSAPSVPAARPAVRARTVPSAAPALAAQSAKPAFVAPPALPTHAAPPASSFLPAQPAPPAAHAHAAQPARAAQPAKPAQPAQPAVPQQLAQPAQPAPPAPTREPRTQGAYRIPPMATDRERAQMKQFAPELEKSTIYIRTAGDTARNIEGARANEVLLGGDGLEYHDERDEDKAVVEVNLMYDRLAKTFSSDDIIAMLDLVCDRMFLGFFPDFCGTWLYLYSSDDYTGPDPIRPGLFVTKNFTKRQVRILTTCRFMTAAGLQLIMYYWREERSHFIFAFIRFRCDVLHIVRDLIAAKMRNAAALKKLVIRQFKRANEDADNAGQVISAAEVDAVIEQLVDRIELESTTVVPRQATAHVRQFSVYINTDGLIDEEEFKCFVASMSALSIQYPAYGKSETYVWKCEQCRAKNHPTGKCACQVELGWKVAMEIQRANDARACAQFPRRSNFVAGRGGHA